MKYKQRTKSLTPVKGWVKKVCIICKTIFYKPKGRALENKRCSFKCYGLSKTGIPGHKHTKESRRKLSIAKIGAKNPMHGLFGDKNHNWKGGYTIERYLRNTRTKKWAHREVMEAFLGRSLTSNEVVHHINGNKLDNRIENLELMDKASHARHHINERMKNEHHKFI